MDENLLTTTNNPSSLAKEDKFSFDTTGSTATLSKVDPNQLVEGFSFDVPQTLTSNDISGDATIDDVFSARSVAQEQQDAPTQDFSVPENTSGALFNDPTEEIKSILEGDATQSEAEIEQARQLSGATRATERISGQLGEARTRAEGLTDFGGISQELAGTREDIARRQSRFRRESRAFETDASVRGVAREFVTDKRNKMQADATAELADLYIIENAQAGNVANAERYITTAVNERYRIFETEIANRQARLAELEPTLQGEAQRENLRLQMALAERQAGIDEQKAIETGKRQLLAQAAANGADANTRSQILNAETLDEAYGVAGGFIGRLDRIKAEQSIANASLDRRAKLIQLAQAGDKQAIESLGGTYDFVDPDAMTSEDYLANQREYNDIERQLTKWGTMLEDNTTGRDLSSGIVQSPLLSGVAQAYKVAFTRDISGAIDIKNYHSAKAAYLGAANEMVTTFAFRELVDLKAQGATFGALSEGEFNAIKTSALGLNSIATHDASGKVIGFTDEGLAQFYVEEALAELKRGQERLNADVLTEEERASILR